MARVLASSAQATSIRYLFYTQHMHLVASSSRLPGMLMAIRAPVMALGAHLEPGFLRSRRKNFRLAIAREKQPQAGRT